MSRRYLNPKKVEAEGRGGPISIKVYKGLNDAFDPSSKDEELTSVYILVAPNPRDKELSDEVYCDYACGLLLDCNTFQLTEAQFADPEFWNAE